MDEIKPCLWCGSPAALYGNAGSWYIGTDCKHDVKTPVFKTRDIAIKYWNSMMSVCDEYKRCGNCKYWYRDCDGVMSCMKHQTEFEVKRYDSCKEWERCW